LDMEFWRERITRAAWHVDDVAAEIEAANDDGWELPLAGFKT
jgi:hypothetical protein